MRGRRFREDDPLGGTEPYALSKAGAEFAVRAYWGSRQSREHPDRALVTVRAGNIVGGGDWAADRLVPDAVRAFVAAAPLVLRKPDAVRPWQFVLDAVEGLLLLAEGGLRRSAKILRRLEFRSARTGDGDRRRCRRRAGAALGTTGELAGGRAVRHRRDVAA